MEHHFFFFKGSINFQKLKKKRRKSCGGRDAYFVSWKEKSGRQQLKRILKVLSVCLFLNFPEFQKKEAFLEEGKSNGHPARPAFYLFLSDLQEWLKGTRVPALLSAGASKGSWGRRQRWKGRGVIIFLCFDPIPHSRHRSSAAVYLHSGEEPELLALICPGVMSLTMFPPESTKASQ